jgi:hypothetical protein
MTDDPKAKAAGHEHSLEPLLTTLVVLAKVVPVIGSVLIGLLPMLTVVRAVLEFWQPASSLRIGRAWPGAATIRSAGRRKDDRLRGDSSTRVDMSLATWPR